VFEIASYKGLVIALILANGELLKIELFDDTCAEFWNKNVTVHEKKIKLPKHKMIFVHTHLNRLSTLLRNYRTYLND
jgi:hypothetical protein